MIIDQLPALVTAGNNDEIAIEVGTTTYKIKKSDFLKEFMPKSGGEFTGNVTVGGVLDVTNRRCYATLSQEGWYRVMTFSDPNQTESTACGAPSRFISFYITRGYSSNNNEVHKIDYLNPYCNYKFANETSVSNQMIIDKIRSTKSGGNMHIDIHYSASTSNAVSVEFDVHTMQTLQSLYTAVIFTPVAVSPNGETVLKEYTFAANTISPLVRQISYTGTTDANGNLEIPQNVANYMLHNYVLQYASTYATALTIAGNLLYVKCFKYNGTAQANANVTVHLLEN